MLYPQLVRFIFTGSFYVTFTLYCPRRTGVTFAQSSAKVTKSALFPYRSERTKNHRGVEIYPLVWDKRGVTALFSVMLSVIFRFLLSASWEVFSHISASRQLSGVFPLLSSFTGSLLVCHASLSQAFTISLPDIR